MYQYSIIITIIINIVTITGKNSYEEEKQWKENQWYLDTVVLKFVVEVCREITLVVLY